MWWWSFPQLDWTYKVYFDKLICTRKNDCEPIQEGEMKPKEKTCIKGAPEKWVNLIEIQPETIKLGSERNICVMIFVSFLMPRGVSTRHCQS